MFEKFKTKAAGLGQKFLVKVGQAEEFQEDETFTNTITQFKATRESYRLLVEKGKAMIAAENNASAARAAYVCIFI